MLGIGADLWAFIAVTVIAIVALGWMLSEAASQADEALEEFARDRERRGINR